MSKKLSGVLCFVPLVLFVVSMVLFLIFYIGHYDDPRITGTEAVLPTIALVGVILSVIVVYAVMIWLIITACRNPAFSENRKIFWAIMLYLFNMFAFPIYWFRYIYKEEEYVKANEEYVKVNEEHIRPNEEYLETNEERVDANEERPLNDDFSTEDAKWKKFINFSTVSMVLGLISLICCCLPTIGLFFAAAAVILGIIAMKKQCDGKGMAITGVVTGGIVIIIWIMIFLMADPTVYRDLLI